MFPFNRFIQSYVHQGRIGVLIEFGLETWLVTEGDRFLQLSHSLAMHVAACDPDTVDTLLEQPFVKDNSILVKTVLSEASQSLGERITVTRFIRWDQAVKLPENPTPPKRPAVVMRLKKN
jgi:elongation factor Ts